MTRRRRNNRARNIVIIAALVIIALTAFMYNAQIFERKPPQIALEGEIFWNLKTPLSVKISDDNGIKRVLTQISDGENNITLINEKYSGSKKELEFNITFPKTGFYSKKNQYYLSFEVVDKSFWNFFMGNKAEKTSIINVDTKQPNLYVVANSYKVTKGGSALVIFKAEDDNLKETYIQTNFNKRFKAYPFNDKGYYIALVAWPVKEKNFAAEVVATDMAGNIARNRIKYFLQDKTYRTSKINLSDNFLNNSVSPLAAEFAPEETKNLSALEKFIYINEKIRNESVGVLSEKTSKVSGVGTFLDLRPFSPLKNGAVVAGFGDFRVYEYNKTKVSQSYHLGLDMASTAEAEIVLSNSGKVVFADHNGIYGNMLLVDHGLGLYSLYAHCSSLSLSDGADAIAGQLLGRTGKTGFVFGDHLHFGIVVQGVEVRPEEWLDEKWMRENIYDQIENAKRVIESAK